MFSRPILVNTTNGRRRWFADAQPTLRPDRSRISDAERKSHIEEDVTDGGLQHDRVRREHEWYCHRWGVELVGGVADKVGVGESRAGSSTLSYLQAAEIDG
jgi:hypothetical protein